MISQEEIGFKSYPRESRFSPPKQRAPSGQAVSAGAVSGGLIYDPASRSLRYPKLGGGLKGEKKNVGTPILQGNSLGKRGGITSGEKDAGSPLSADGGPYEHQSADDSSPRCVITNSILESSTSTSPSGSKSVSEMDDYSDVKQLITHNRSSSPSDADDDGFFGSLNGQKSAGFRPLDANLDNPVRQKNVKGNGELVQKLKHVTATTHSRSISTSAVPGIDSFQKLSGKDGGQQETLELESMSHLNSDLGSVVPPPNHPSSADIGPLLDSAGVQSISKMKTKGGGSFRGSQSHELISLNENGWGDSTHPTAATIMKNSPLDPILESLMKASISKEQQFKHGEKVEEIKRKNGVNGINNSVKTSVQSISSSFTHGGTGAFSFNQTHVVRMNDADFLDYDSNYDNVSNSSLDFSRGDIKGVHRTVLNNLTKPAPSKWDDAEKWLSSEPQAVNRGGKAKSGPQGHPLLAQGALALSKKAAFLNQAGRLIPNITQLAKLSHVGNSGSDVISSGDVGIASNDGDDLMSKGERTKKMDTMKFIANDSNQDEGGQGPRFSFPPTSGLPAGKARTGDGSLDRYPLDDPFVRENGDAIEGSTSPDARPLMNLDPALRTEKPTSDSPPKEESTSQLDIAKLELPSPIGDAVPKVCMRDMGTAMTPIASVEPSRAPTPVCARTPTLRSPTSSRPATPSRVVPTSSPTCETEKKVHYTDKELQSKTRQEILALGTQLGKHNIAAWATKEEEEEDAFKSLKNNVDLEEVRKVVIATRAAAWEEAEQAKYMARYKREEAKIQAWENHEKAKAEAEMRRIEMKIERMRSHANEKLMNKLAATRRSAEELRAAAAARRGEQASKTSQRAEYIRRTGKVPGSLFASLCCS